MTAWHGAPVRSAIGFHPGLDRPQGIPDGPITAKVLMMIGEEDPVIEPHHRTDFENAMRASGADWQLHVLSVGHSYTNPGVDARNIPGIAMTNAQPGPAGP